MSTHVTSPEFVVSHVESSAPNREAWNEKRPLLNPAESVAPWPRGSAKPISRFRIPAAMGGPRPLPALDLMDALGVKRFAIPMESHSGD
jgi:hypothetical protein